MSTPVTLAVIGAGSRGNAYARFAELFPEKVRITAVADIDAFRLEQMAKKHNIPLEKGWKVKLATLVKREILKGTDKVISESNDEFKKILELFAKITG